jgi:predicted amidohydrolase YtcJ
MLSSLLSTRVIILLIAGYLIIPISSCRRETKVDQADTILVNGRVYTFTWDDPSPDGVPAANAPHSGSGWRPDADAIAIRGERIVFAGKSADAQKYRGDRTRVIDLNGATVIPGLVDSHVHIAGLGERQNRVDLTNAQTEEEAVNRVAAYAAKVPKGEWIIGQGWDEGAWANRYPTMKLLSERVPDHPVFMASLHGFAAWGNRVAFDKAGITRHTQPPVGGIIIKDQRGEPTGILLNRATTLLSTVVPSATDEQLKSYVLAGLETMARDGYVAVHEAGADSRLMRAFESLGGEGKLPIRVYTMLSARDAGLCRAWLAKGPQRETSRKLTVRSVKAYCGGARFTWGAVACRLFRQTRSPWCERPTVWL